MGSIEAHVEIPESGGPSGAELRTGAEGANG